MRLKNQNYVNGELLLKNMAVNYAEPVATKEKEPPVKKRAKKAKEDK